MRKADPGVPENCAVCNLLKVYSNDWESQWQEDREGIRGCMQNKQECIEVINEHLRPFRERRSTISDADIEEILAQGAAEAREFAAQTMVLVRQAMKMY